MTDDPEGPMDMTPPSTRRRTIAVRSARVAVAAALVAASAMVATPATAAASDFGRDCDGDVRRGFSDMKVLADIPIEVDGVEYGIFRVGRRNYVDSDGALKFRVAYAVKDTRKDGAAPYIRTQETDLEDATTGGDVRIINRRSAASGWVCATTAGFSHVKRIVVWGSVADRPAVAEPVVAEIVGLA